MKQIGCPETSAGNYYYTLREIPKDRRSHLRKGESLKPHTISLRLSSTSNSRPCLEILPITTL